MNEPINYCPGCGQHVNSTYNYCPVCGRSLRSIGLKPIEPITPVKPIGPYYDDPAPMWKGPWMVAEKKPYVPPPPCPVEYI